MVTEQRADRHLPDPLARSNRRARWAETLAYLVGAPALLSSNAGWPCRSGARSRPAARRGPCVRARYTETHQSRHARRLISTPTCS